MEKSSIEEMFEKRTEFRPSHNIRKTGFTEVRGLCAERFAGDRLDRLHIKEKDKTRFLSFFLYVDGRGGRPLFPMA